MSAQPDPSEIPREEEEFLAATYREASKLIERAFKQRVYALHVSRDPAVRSRVEAAEAEIAAGKAHEGELTLAEYLALRESEQ